MDFSLWQFENRSNKSPCSCRVKYNNTTGRSWFLFFCETPIFLWLWMHFTQPLASKNKWCKCESTWCRSCRRRCSWDSSCLLCSSRMCMRASNRPLCWRSSLASANRSASSGWLKEVSDSHWPTVEAPRWPCCSFSWSYSLCSNLGIKKKQHVTVCHPQLDNSAVQKNQ